MGKNDTFINSFYCNFISHKLSYVFSLVCFREAHASVNDINPFSDEHSTPSSNYLFNASSFAQRLVDKKCSTDAINKATGMGCTLFDYANAHQPMCFLLHIVYLV